MNREFLITNDVQQFLDPNIFGGGPWMHLATITTPIKNINGHVIPSKEYICFKHYKTNKLYIEEVDLTSPALFKKIKDDSLWKDLAQFLTEKGYLAFVKNKEYKFVKPKK